MMTVSAMPERLPAVLSSVQADFPADAEHANYPARRAAHDPPFRRPLWRQARGGGGQNPSGQYDSVMRYVRGRQLTEAARCLASGAPDILAIALEAGYGSHEAFTRAFAISSVSRPK